MKITLRDYQNKDSNEIRNSFRNFRKILYVLPTGGGKTYLFVYMAMKAVEKNNRVIILVHRQELIRQTSEALDNLGVKHGVIAAGYSMTGDKVQVASVQTLVRRLGVVAVPKFIIMDEAHHGVAGSYKKIVDHWSKAALLGVTATPCRRDGRGLGEIFENMVIGPSMKKLIKDGYLSQSIVYRPPSLLDTKGLKKKMGDYDKKELAIRTDKRAITGNAIEHYLRICPNVPAVAFCVNIKHAIHVAEEFNAAGIPAAALAGDDLTDSMRRYRLKALETGKIKVLTSCEIISEGTDIPVITAAILLRKTESTSLYLQQTGRASRVSPNKEYAIVLDHVGNSIEHGLPDQERKWTLEGYKKNKKKKNDDEENETTRQCETCYAVYEKTLTHCPQCGEEFKIKVRKIEYQEGNLEIANEKELLLLQEKKKQRMEIGRANSLEELIKIGKKRKYKSNWAYYYWRKLKKRKKVG